MENVNASLFDFIEKCPSPYFTVEASKDFLRKHGFEELRLSDVFQLRRGGAYFVDVYGSTLFAFRVGEKAVHGTADALRIAASHTDFPCLRIKPNADTKAGKYLEWNVEIYGGMIYRSWLDRPLSLAGKVILKGENAFSPKTVLVDLKRPVVTIPSLAIHMDREVNKGVEIKPQMELLPLVGMKQDAEAASEEDGFRSLLQKEMGTEEEVLSYDLSVYTAEKGEVVGFSEEFLSSPRLDNLTSVKASLDAIVSDKDSAGIRLCALFDNEEVGSQTKQGAGSAVLRHVMERIYEALGDTKEDLERDIAAGFMLSVDVAHAVHPAHEGKSDPTNKVFLNDGVVLKQAASQSYAGDAEAVAVISALCEEKEIPYQRFVNRAGIRGGSTLGSIASCFLPIRTMDIGVPILAMHSAREMMGSKDQKALTDLLKVFFYQKK